jgi:hypothetical protein
MVDRLLIVEQDPEDPAVWRYGLADGTGELVDAAHLRHDPLTGSVPLVLARVDPARVHEATLSGCPE